MITVYISIGNSDDKLPQAHWSAYAATVMGSIRRAAKVVHGEWTSLPFSSFQNACWCIEIDPDSADLLKLNLASIAGDYRQESIAWAVAETWFLTPGTGSA